MSTTTYVLWRNKKISILWTAKKHLIKSYVQTVKSRLIAPEKQCVQRIFFFFFLISP